MPQSDVILESCGAVIGPSRLSAIDRVVYVEPLLYGQLPIADRYALARVIGRLIHLPAAQAARQHHADRAGALVHEQPRLGVPVSFAEIDRVSVICEIVAMRDDLVPDVSLGTHFFNDLVELDILYFALFPGRPRNHWNREYFLQSPNRLAELLPDAAKWAAAAARDRLLGRRQRRLPGPALRQHARSRSCSATGPRRAARGADVAGRIGNFAGQGLLSDSARLVRSNRMSVDGRRQPGGSRADDGGTRHGKNAAASGGDPPGAQQAADARSSARITRSLESSGHPLSERTVRLYLRQLEQEGLTESQGRQGHVITRTGIGRVAGGSCRGWRGVPVRQDRPDDVQHVVRSGHAHGQRGGQCLAGRSAAPGGLREQVCEVFAKGYAMGNRVALLAPGETVGKVTVPPDRVGFCTICSITLNGVLLKHGIPTTSRFGGLLELRAGCATRFVEIIYYDGTTIDPLEVFIRSGMTDYLGAVRDGQRPDRREFP